MKQIKRVTSLLLAILLSFSACQPRNEVVSDEPIPSPQTQEKPAETPPAPPEVESPIHFDSPEEMQLAFDEFILEEFIAQLDNDYLAIHSTLRKPEDYGIDIREAEISLGDAINEATIAEIRAQNQEAQESFAVFDYELLTEEQQETYRVYEHLLNCALDSVKDEFVYMGNVFSPMSGLQNDIASFLMEFSFYEEYDVQAYLELMRDVPRYVEDHLEYTRKQAELGYFMSDSSVRETMAYCKKIIDAGMDSALLSAVLYNIENCVFLGDVQIQSYSREAKDIFQNCILPAYQNIYDSLFQLAGSDGNQMGLYWLENGRDYYESLFRLKTASDRSIEDTKKLLTQYLLGAAEEVASIAEEYKLIYTSYTGGRVHTDFESYREALDGLEYYSSLNFPAINTVDYRVDLLDPLVTVEGISAYYVVPPLGDNAPQKIKINPMQDMEPDSFYTLQLLAHEGFPGHLYQTNYVQQNLDNPYRQSTSLLGYSEGYATYVELLSTNYLLELDLWDKDDFFFDENTVTLMQSYSLFENCLIALCDIGIHYDGWTLEETTDFMQQYLDIDYVDVIYDQLVGDPACFLSYYVGCVEFLDLRHHAQDELCDRFVDADFHEVILQGGDLPFSVLKEKVEAYINSKKA